jgi:hypothetical protein
MGQITKIAKERGFFVVEDAAEALLSKHENRWLGTFGHTGCFSFSPNKTITTGQGGMVVTDDEALAVRLRELDERAAQGKRLDRNDMFGFLFRDLVLGRKDLVEGDEPVVPILQFLRSVSEPLFPSKKDLAFAVDALLKEARPHDRFPPAGHPRPREAAHPARRAGAPEEGGAAEAGGRRRRRRRGRGRRRGGAPGAGPTPA